MRNPPGPNDAESIATTVVRIAQHLTGDAARAFIEGDPEVRAAIFRRDTQPIPQTSLQAARAFDCAAYLTRIGGVACAKRHAFAEKTLGREDAACIGCPAGVARARILSVDKEAVIRGVRCARERCPEQASHIGPLGEYCRECEGRGRTIASIWRGRGARGTTVDLARVYLAEKAAHRGSPVRAGIVPDSPPCAREKCSRPSRPASTVLPEFCLQCSMWSTTHLRHRGVAKPTEAQRIDLLVTEPLRPPIRPRPSAPPAPQ